MIEPVKVIDIVRDDNCQTKYDIVNKYEVVDGMYSIDAVELTDKEIDVLKEGKYLYFNDGEYAHILYYGGSDNAVDS